MEEKQLTAQPRTELKKGAAGRIRRDGGIPAIIYGHHEPVPITVNAREFHKLFRRISESTIINLEVDSSTYGVLVKDYQEDILTGRVLHIDFYEFERGRALRTHVPVHVSGSPKGVREGGILEHPLHEFEIECLPKDLPDEIVVDVSDLEVGSSIHVADVAAPEGVRILNSEDQVVALVTAPRAEAVRAEEEEEEEVEAEEPEEAEE